MANPSSVERVRQAREIALAPFRNMTAEAGSTLSLREAWRHFESRVAALGFDWALRDIPSDTHWNSTAVLTAPGWDAGFPESYRRFLEQASFPSFAFCRDCRDGFSFLPPGPMAALSPMIGDDEQEITWPIQSGTAPCRYRFFAGIELSDLDGWAFCSDASDPSGVVWNVVGGMVRRPAGTFEGWLTSKLSVLVAHMEAMPRDEIARLAKSHDLDPHRILDSSVKR